MIQYTHNLYIQFSFSFFICQSQFSNLNLSKIIFVQNGSKSIWLTNLYKFFYKITTCLLRPKILKIILLFFSSFFITTTTKLFYVKHSNPFHHKFSKSSNISFNSTKQSYHGFKWWSWFAISIICYLNWTRRDRCKEIGGCSTKRKPWVAFAIEDDTHIISSWLNISIDPIVGVSQAKKAFWLIVMENYNKFRGKLHKRIVNQLKSQWQKINLSVQKFKGHYKQVISLKKSGCTDNDAMLHAYAIWKETIFVWNMLGEF